MLLSEVFLITDKTRCPDTTEVVYTSKVLLDRSCQRRHNETCSYSCYLGYVPTNTSEPYIVTCTTTSAWDRPLSSLCEEIKCPTTIPHGNISELCDRGYNSICYSYSCDIGFRRPSYRPALTCNARGQWEWLQYRMADFCIDEANLCPGVIKNGRIDARCDRDEWDRCSFSCDKGCKKHSNIHGLTCHNKNWVVYMDVDTDLLCTDCVQCNGTIPHGSIEMANCYAGQNCSYSCDDNSKYVKNENITTVICSNATNGWIHTISETDFTSENDLCIARRCSTDIPNGNLLSSCSAEVGSVCRYKCDVDYHGNISEINCQSRQLWTSEVVTFWSVDTRQLCTNNQQCPLAPIPHGTLDPSCSRNPGDVCPYTCGYGYRAYQTSITCTSSSTWNTSLSLLCERITCPSRILNGYTSCYSNSYNDRCTSYYCDNGYQPSNYNPSLTCSYEGLWEWTDPSPLKFCLDDKELCSSNIQDGWLSSDCHRTEGSMCTYHCSWCKSEKAPYMLTCRNKTWDSDTNHLCTQCKTTTTVAPVRCPSRIPGGNVYSSCDRTPLSTCSYYCDSGCTYQLASLRCNSYGEWLYGNSACSCPTCPYSIPNGYISWGAYTGYCDFKPGSSCNVKCNEGCTVWFSTAICDSTGQWNDADYLCNCKESTDTSDGGTRIISIVMTIVGVIVFLVIVACVYTACHKRSSQRPTQSDRVSRSGFQQPSNNTTSTINNSQCSTILTLSGQETRENIPIYLTNANYIQGPPPYSELSFSKTEQDTPPPSYEDVTSHPLEFTQHTIDSTTDNTAARS